MWLVEIRQMSLLIDILDSFYLSWGDGLLLYLLGGLLYSFSLYQNKNIIRCPLFTYLWLTLVCFSPKWDNVHFCLFLQTLISQIPDTNISETFVLLLVRMRAAGSRGIVTCCGFVCDAVWVVEESSGLFFWESNSLALLSLIIYVFEPSVGHPGLVSWEQLSTVSITSFLMIQCFLFSHEYFFQLVVQ